MVACEAGTRVGSAGVVFISMWYTPIFKRF